MRRTNTPLRLERLAAALHQKGRLLRQKEMALLEGGQPKDYKLIPLLNGIFAMVDNEDYESLNAHLWWCNNGYASRRTRGSKQMIWMHRVIMNCPSHLEVDHENRTRWDNRKSNLRTCTKLQNQGNRWKSKHAKTSSFKGVYWCKKLSKFVAYGRHGSKNKRLGTFERESDAAKAYNNWAKSYFGEFALLNPV